MHSPTCDHGQERTVCYQLPNGELVRPGDSRLLGAQADYAVSQCLRCGMVAWSPPDVTPLLEYATPSDRDRAILRAFPPSEDEALL